MGKATVVSAIFAAVCSLAAKSAWAQNLYKHVDANGKVTYTDLPLTPEEQQLQIANTTRNGDGSRALGAKMNKAPSDNKTQSKGKARARGRPKKSATGAGDKSQQ